MYRALIKLFGMACIATTASAYASVTHEQNASLSTSNTFVYFATLPTLIDVPLHATMQAQPSTEPVKIQTRHLAPAAAHAEPALASDEGDSDHAGRTTAGAVLATLVFMGAIALRRNRSKGR